MLHTDAAITSNDHWLTYTWKEQ